MKVLTNEPGCINNGTGVIFVCMGKEAACFEFCIFVVFDSLCNAPLVTANPSSGACFGRAGFPQRPASAPFQLALFKTRVPAAGNFPVDFCGEQMK